MDRRRILCMLVMLALAYTLTACGTEPNNVKVYENTEDVTASHEELTMTAIITSMDMDNNLLHFVSVQDGTDVELQYHGGVGVYSAQGTDIGISGVACGSVVDIVYYADTGKLVQITQNAKVKTYTGVKKFAYRTDNNTAAYNGASFKISDYAKAFDGDREIALIDVNTEDEVTLYVWNGTLLSVVITKGHGYIRLLNQ